MKTSELIHEARVNVLRDISTAVGGSPVDDAIWADSTLALYLRDAESKFASQTLCLRDSITPAVTQITLEAGVSAYPHHKAIKVVYGAVYDGKNHLNRTGYNTRFGGVGDLNPGIQRVESEGTGTPSIFYTDKDTNYIGFYPIPGPQEDGKIVTLRVARPPYQPISIARLESESEIPEEYHLDLVEWACWRALRNHDADLESTGESIQMLMAKASSHKNRFEAAIKECLRDQKRHTVQHVQFAPNANWS